LNNVKKQPWNADEISFPFQVAPRGGGNTPCIIFGWKRGFGLSWGNLGSGIGILGGDSKPEKQRIHPAPHQKTPFLPKWIE
jgi:hypothetical protein